MGMVGDRRGHCRHSGVRHRRVRERQQRTAQLREPRRTSPQIRLPRATAHVHVHRQDHDLRRPSVQVALFRADAADQLTAGSDDGCSPRCLRGASIRHRVHPRPYRSARAARLVAAAVVAADRGEVVMSRDFAAAGAGRSVPRKRRRPSRGVDEYHGVRCQLDTGEREVVPNRCRRSGCSRAGRDRRARPDGTSARSGARWAGRPAVRPPPTSRP